MSDGEPGAVTGGEAAAGDPDLVLCHQEPIRVPGSVQPHGVLLALEGPTLTVRRASASLEPLLGHRVASALGAPLERLLGREAAAAVAAAAEALGTPDGSLADPVNAIPGGVLRTFELDIEVRGEPHRADAVVHRTGGLTVLELDGVASSAGAAGASRPAVSIGTVQRLVRELHGARTPGALCDTIAREVRALAGFDRVMVYRFHDDGHGEVVAESVVEGWSPYLGLHYPESDIPAQARELYRRNWIRCIAEVPYVPSPILPAEAAPLDLALAHLRSVSPIHVEYLQNMGVGASMSISLLDGERLWGLIACHHRTARPVPTATRLACELLGTTFSLLLPSLEAVEGARADARLHDLERRLLDGMAGTEPFADGAFGALPSLAELLGADGVASVSGETVRCEGSTPPAERLLELAGRLDRALDDAGTATATPDDEAPDEASERVAFEEGVFATARARARMPLAAAWPARVAGVLVIVISRARRQYLMAFRDEQVLRIDWAGRPDEKHVVDAGEGRQRLAPRRSFERWSESVSGVSAAWTTAERRVARTLRRSLLKLVVEAAEEVLKLNRELARSRDDLRSFAHLAAHDLKEPLRGIGLYAALLIEDHGEALDPSARTSVEAIMRLAERGGTLTSALLEFAEAGREPGPRERFALREVVDEVIETFAPELAHGRVELHVREPLPTLAGERVALAQVLVNLVGNAIKYAEPRRAPGRIEIVAERNRPHAGAGTGEEAADDRSHVISVVDDGIGIASEYHEQVFDPFRRLHPRAAHFGGSGLGLAIVRRLIERHGGRVTLESEPGVGSAFRFTYGEPAEDTPSARS